MEWMTILALALSSSIDNFGVGISYGIRGIKIGLWSNLIISIIAFVFSIAGIYFGHFLSKVLPGMFSIVLGALFLVIIGLRIILLAIPKKKKTIPEGINEQASSKQTITGLLSSPEKADIDQSGHISLVESVFLGIAVSMNALTNGLGAGLIGLSPLAISISSAIFSYLAIWSGCVLGCKVSTVKIGAWTIGQFSTVLSGVILLLIALKSLL